MRTALEFFNATVAAVAAGARPPDPARMIERLDGVPRDLPARPAVEPAAGKLSIALVCREYPPETAWGGMATFTYHLAHGLADAGHRVAVITGGRPLVRQDHDGRVDVVQIEPRLGGARDSFESLNRRGWLTYGPLVFLHGLGAVRAIDALEEAHGPFDVLDLADHAADGLAPALYCHGPRTVRLYSPWALLAGMGLYGDAGNEAALPFLESALLHRATLLTSPSEDLAARTMTMFDLHSPFAMVPNPIDADHFSPAAPREGNVRVCFVGRLEERKGIHTLLAAIPAVLAASPDVEFEIIGPDDDGLADTVAPKHRGRVHFQERVPLSELQLVYQRSSLAVVPSLYDNSPYTCIEPMACGIPVVGTSAGGTAEYVIDEETGIIVPARDHEALAEAILRLAGDPGLRERFGNAGRAHVERNFELHAVATRMEAAYRLAIAGGGEPWVAAQAGAARAQRRTPGPQPCHRPRSRRHGRRRPRLPDGPQRPG